MTVTPEELEVAGLYDPGAPNAAERLELLEWLVDDQGFTIEEMRKSAAVDPGHLTRLAADRALRGAARYTLRDLTEKAGLDREWLEALFRGIGYPLDDEDAVLFTDADLASFRNTLAAQQIFPGDALLRFGRTLSLAMARIAEAANSLFMADVEAALVEEGGTEVELAQATLRAMQLLDGLPSTFSSMFRMQMALAIERGRRERDKLRRERGSDLARVAVGFVDLTGYTTATRQMKASELAALVDHVEMVSNDTTVGRDARVVKLVGDEVMYVAVTPAEAVAVARDLVDAFGERPDVEAHGGIASGEVLARGGDYYGPIVNLAARISELAVPGEVLVTRSVADEVEGLEPAGRRMLKGFDEPVELFSLTLDS